MPHLSITTNIDEKPWEDVREFADKYGMAQVTRVARVPRGMKSGKSSVGFLIELPNGDKVIAETSMALFQAAARAFAAVEGEQLDSL